MFGSAIFAGLPIAASSSVAEFEGAHAVTLVENRANEISVPAVVIASVHTRLMRWDDPTNTFVTASGSTRISEFIKQVNKRYRGSSTLTNLVVSRAEAIDADTGNRLVFTPGATVAGSLHDFEVIIQDQDGDYESRGFVVILAANANPGILDGGDVVLRLTPDALPW
jgi:hypothetical protein